jgi:hypothetical protein
LAIFAISHAIWAFGCTLVVWFFLTLYSGKGTIQSQKGNLFLRDRFDILLEKKSSGVAELRYAMLYGKSQLSDKWETSD